jgi:hypothetical protein
MQAEKLRIGAGWGWISAGARLFRQNPLALWPVVAGYWLTLGLASAVPVVGLLLAAFLIPALAVGTMTACRDSLAKRPVTLLTLYVAFRPPGRDFATLQRLFILGALHFFLSLAILGIAALFDGGALFRVVTGTLSLGDAATLPGVQTAANLAFLLSAPLTMAFWYAPVLVAWHDLSIGKAVFFSFIACWRNWKPFLAYGFGLTLIALIVVIFVGQLALGLGMLQATAPILTVLFLLVLAPVLFATFYISYRDVFAAPPAVDETA